MAIVNNPEFSNQGEMVTATLRGYRSWNLRLADPEENGIGSSKWILGSVGLNTWWEDKEITAKCLKYGSGFMGTMNEPSFRAGHDAPYNGCTCGIYGWYEPEWALRNHSGSVMGVVEFSGRILMGSKGFRAEKAKVIGLTIGSSTTAKEQFCKSVHFIDYVHRFVETMKEGANDSIVKINYGGLQKFITERMSEQQRSFRSSIGELIAQMDIEYFDNVDELKDKYPPNLDTVENVIGKKLKRYTSNGDPSNPF